jgi:hypothetical protein
VVAVREWRIYPHSMSRAWGEVLFPTCIIGMFSILITFLAGLVSRGTQRIALVSAAIVVALMYIFRLGIPFRGLGLPARHREASVTSANPK